MSAPDRRRDTQQGASVSGRAGTVDARHEFPPHSAVLLASRKALKDTRRPDSGRGLPISDRLSSAIEDRTDPKVGRSQSRCFESQPRAADRHVRTLPYSMSLIEWIRERRYTVAARPGRKRRSIREIVFGRRRKRSRSHSPVGGRSPNGHLGRNVVGTEPDRQARERRPADRNPDGSIRERSEKRTRPEALPREAGEIAEDQLRDPKRSRPDSRSHRRPKDSREGLPPRRHSEPSPARPDRRGQREERRTPGKADREPNQKVLTPPRLTTIPAEIRKAALEAQKREQARQAAAAADLRKSSDEEGEVLPSSGSAQAKHTPILWPGAAASVAPGETARLAQQTAAEIAALELYKLSQEAMYDPDAPPAMKASPSASGSEDGETTQQPAAVESDLPVEPEPVQLAIKSRWLVDDEEDDQTAQPPAVNGKAGAAQELADLAALNESERQELEIDAELVADAGGSEGEEDSPSDFQATRREISMLNACRRVECYERLNRISEGTYGVVYRARDRETGVVCALKRIKMEKEKDGFPLTSIREINILLSFQHRNIVDVTEVVVGDSLDQIYMVMEFMEHDLKGLMDDMTEPFTVAETKNLMKQLLEGMEYLHGNWVLHRDLKTSNILYNNRGQLKICDFGLARQYGSPLRPYTHNVVTLYYRSIELLLGCEQYSTAVDVWSLGCIMAELLTKKVLFQGTGELDQIDKIFKVMGSPTDETWPGYRKLPNLQKIQLRVQPKTLRSLIPAASRFDPNSGLTEAGMDLLERMLAIDPAARISAKAALEHPWFEEQPLPKDNALMPTYPTSKDGTTRSSRQRLHRKASPRNIGGPNFALRGAEIGMLFGRK